MQSVLNVLNPPILFFILGVTAYCIRSDLKFPSGFTSVIAIYLMIGIGIHGGVELRLATLNTALLSIISGLFLGVVCPIIAYSILRHIVKLDKLNASAIAAHYGSVSVGTFMVAVGFLNLKDIDYESYPVIMLAIMESPAIIVGLLLANSGRQHVKNIRKKESILNAIHQAFTNNAVVLLMGGIIIGYVLTQHSIESIMPFYQTAFAGVLSLFLLAIGLEAAKRISEFWDIGLTLCLFGITMPLIGASLGLFIGHYVLQLSLGGVTLVSVLGASASYIAVPPAMKLAIPEANPSFYLILSLGVTFPFNILIGIPLYFKMATWLVGTS